MTLRELQIHLQNTIKKSEEAKKEAFERFLLQKEDGFNRNVDDAADLGYDWGYESGLLEAYERILESIIRG